MGIILGTGCENPVDPESVGDVVVQVSAEGGDPVADAWVWCSAADDSSQTDASGVATLLRVPAGQHTLDISAQGMAHFREDILVTAGRTLAVNATLLAAMPSLSARPASVLFSEGNLTEELVIYNAATDDTISWWLSGLPDWLLASEMAGNTLGDTSRVQLQCQSNMLQMGSASGSLVVDSHQAGHVVIPLAVNRVESFEECFSLRTWSIQEWRCEEQASWQGNRSACSGEIGHGQVSSLQLAINLAQSGTLHFHHKESSESNFDFLLFYVDGSERGRWSGEHNWQSMEWSLSAGSHTLQWQYRKDGSVVSGQDAVWIDHISIE